MITRIAVVVVSMMIALCWRQERLLTQNVRHRLQFGLCRGDNDVLRQDLAENLLVSTADMWHHQHCQVSLLPLNISYHIYQFSVVFSCCYS